MKLLEGKTAIITGASRGIGSGVARVFAENGSNVAFTYSSSVDSAIKLQDELLKHGIKVKSYKSDELWSMDQLNQVMPEQVEPKKTHDKEVEEKGKPS